MVRTFICGWRSHRKLLLWWPLLVGCHVPAGPCIRWRTATVSARQASCGCAAQTQKPGPSWNAGSNSGGPAPRAGSRQRQDAASSGFDPPALSQLRNDLPAEVDDTGNASASGKLGRDRPLVPAAPARQRRTGHPGFVTDGLVTAGCTRQASCGYAAQTQKPGPAGHFLCDLCPSVVYFSSKLRGNAGGSLRSTASHLLFSIKKGSSRRYQLLPRDSSAGEAGSTLASRPWPLAPKIHELRRCLSSSADRSRCRRNRAGGRASGRLRPCRRDR